MKKRTRLTAAAVIAGTMAIAPQAHAGHALNDPPVLHNGVQEHTVDIAVSPLGSAARCLNFHGVEYHCWQYLPSGEKVDLYNAHDRLKVFPFWKHPDVAIGAVRDQIVDLMDRLVPVSSSSGKVLD